MIIDIILVSAISIVSIETKSTPGCEQYSGKKEMELFIILSKILCFFIYKWPRIIG